MERIPMRYILLLAREVHARGSCHIALVVMALVVDSFTSPVVGYLITVRAVVRIDIRHIAYPPAFILGCPTSTLSSVFDTDTLGFRQRDQGYPIDTAVDESLVEVWLLLP